MPTAGKTLKVERVRANVTITAVAARMGLSRTTLWVLERSAAVDAERAAAYRAALQTAPDGKENVA
jgi:transcriptional regulator with XRE-family HTH domain